MVTLMFDFLNFKNNGGPIGFWIWRDCLSGVSTLINCADFEGRFRGSFDFMRRTGADVFEVFMPRSFVKGGLDS